VTLRRLAEPATLWPLLDAIGRDDRAASQVAAASTRHVLGFDKFVLLSLGGSELRMHVWWPGDLRRREHIHNHRFPFASVVLAGTLRSQMFELAESGRKMIHFHETSSRPDDGWRFQRVGSVSIRECLSVEVTPGSAYTMGIDLFHRVEPGSELTATLVLRPPNRRSHSSVLIDPTGSPPAPAPMNPFSVAEFAAKLCALRRALTPVESPRVAATT
jgi:hypothetical protein